MKYIFWAYLILNPYFYTFGDTIRQAQEFFFQFSSMAVCALGLLFGNRELKPDRFNLVLFICLSWAGFIYLCHQTGWSIFFNTFLGCMVYYTAIKTLDKEDIPSIIKCIGLVALYSIVYLLLQNINFDIRGMLLSNPDNDPITPKCSFFALNAAYGMYLAIALPLLLAISPISIPLVIGLAPSLCSMACLAGVVVMQLYYWFRKRIVFWVLLVFSIGGFLSYYFFIDKPLGMMNTRLPMWKMVIQDSHRKPLVGHGFDSFRLPLKDGYARYFKYSGSDRTARAVKRGNDFFLTEAVPQEEKEKMIANNLFDFWDHPHNEFIWAVYEMGLTGIILWFSFLYMIYLRFIRSKKDRFTVALFCSLVSVLICSISQFPFHLARIAHIVPVILALFYIQTKEDVCLK